MPYTQDKRIGEFTTPFGSNKLVLRRFDGIEGVSELFEYRVEAITEDTNLDFDKAIGLNCTVTMKSIEGRDRHFDGILTEVQLLGAGTEGLVYRLILRPWLWLLSRTSNMLIFHEKPVPEIISDIFSEHAGIARYEMQLTSYPKLEYTVQYRESDMAFVCRLMEQHGINFHFRHQKGRHVMHIGEGLSAFRPIEGTTRPYISVEGRYERGKEHIFQWTPERRFTSGKIALMDYNFKTVGANMASNAEGDAKYENGKLELYDYPGKYPAQGTGERYAKWRIDMERSGDGRYLAAGDCVSMVPGDLVQLTEHPDKTQNQRYVAVRCIHSFGGQAYRATGAEMAAYQGNYEFALASKPFAPPVVTEKPYAHGPHTAVVVGDGEIHTDEHGRVRVRFHWDRKGDQSMWVRVAQMWASQNWGGIYIPRVGMEVIVNFLEGDPDQPIIVGCVYNSKNKPPYDLPGKKNMSGIKSNSTTGGGGYNELMMDDSAGNELFRVHAQYDMETKVENDERRHVVKNRTTDIDVDEKLTVGNNRDTTIGVNDTLTVGQELMIKAGMKITLMVGASSIVIDNMSVTVTSATVDIKAMSLFQSDSKMISSHNATGAMNITGGIVKIN
jgi:type VI secretion system secreted protein VgrG